ncbi:putative MFS transporter [Blattamonas nauphoetae]|uniref:MFS transporter n=1 Tax=Blattamonas nauphoetae TaxID=2049346 RepID=A0ABQ9XQB6_9EUKA|nr:putative MFS transporter [Blattamonas nauphoetae]
MGWVTGLAFGLNIGILVAACIIDLCHNRKGEYKYPRKFIFVRFLNWITVGLTYACTYFGRYNISVMNTSDFHAFLGVTATGYGTISTITFIVYATFVVVNGVIVDRIGGKTASIIGAAGSALLNIVTGIYIQFVQMKGAGNIAIMAVLRSVNDYFQTFCTTAIVKVGVNWYHTSERGLFSGIFGVVIAFGFFLAFQVDGLIKSNLHYSLVFYIPGLLLAVFSFLCFFFVHATPEDAGYPPVDDDAILEAEERKRLLDNQESVPINTADGDAASIQKAKGQEKADYGMPLKDLLKVIFCNPVFLILCIVDFCVGWCRDGILQWYPQYFQRVFNMDQASDMYQLASTCVTIGSMFGSFLAGIISDFCCGSRRPPVAFAALIMYTGFIVMTIFAKHVIMGVFGIGLTSFCFSCVHGIITSTCAMDFAGAKATGTATGLLDGIQKIGSALTGAVMGKIWDKFGSRGWLISLIPASSVGAILLIPILFKKPKTKEEKEADRIAAQEKKDAKNAAAGNYQSFPTTTGYATLSDEETKV